MEIRRLYVQDGNVIENSNVNLGNAIPYDSITDEFCSDIKGLFGDPDEHQASVAIKAQQENSLRIPNFQEKGGLQKMGDSFKRGMVLVMSLWDDHEAFMLWLDSNYPEDGDPNDPGTCSTQHIFNGFVHTNFYSGVSRGPCPTTSGRPEDVENEQPEATVKFSKIRYGEIGSTYQHSS